MEKQTRTAELTAYQRELLDLMQSGLSPLGLKKALSDYHESDIGAVLPLLTVAERAKLFRILDVPVLADVMEYADDLGAFLAEMPLRRRMETLTHMENDSVADYLRSLPLDERDTLIDLMDEETRAGVSMLVAYDEAEIGSAMSTNYISVTPDCTVKQAMHELVAQAAENDNIETIYVLDEHGVFYGAMELKDLILAREGTPLETIIKTSYPYVYAQERIDDCIERLREYSEDSVPVLDQSNRMQGVITASAIVELLGDELGEDYAKLAGLSSEEDLREPVRISIRKRLPWLLILLGLGMVVSSVIGAFEGVISQLTLIICFQSLILDMAGNVGTQSLAVTIRVLMDETVGHRDRLRLVGKELRIGACNGLLLGTASFAAIGAYITVAKHELPAVAFATSACIGLALFTSMVMASLAGTTVPILFKRLHIDPAAASGPFITTLNDLIAVVTYYGLAWFLLIQVMQFTHS